MPDRDDKAAAGSRPDRDAAPAGGDEITGRAGHDEPAGGDGGDGTIGAGQHPPVRRNPVPALLTSLLGDALDPGYAQAAERRGRVAGPPPRRRTLVALWYLAVGVLAVGLVLGIAARATADTAPSAERSRSTLLEDVRAAQQRVDQLSTSVSVLAGRIRTAQAALGAEGPLATVSSLERDGAMVPVRGPGLRVVIDNAKGSSGSGAILDSDIQLLVNGLWASGAEAVTVGGVRLRGTSAIRQAGGAILVDNTPVFFPITITAIGEPSRLHVSFASTDGFGRFSAFASLYHIRFDIAAESTVTMPAAPGPDLRYASAAPTG